MKDNTASTLGLPDVKAANARHDAEHGDPYRFQETRVRCGWNEAGFARGEKLTDKQVEKYEAAGYYSADLKAARRELADKRAKKRAERDGNFDAVDGRLVYRL